MVNAGLGVQENKYNNYIKLVGEYFEKNGKTTEIQVDTLVFIYRYHKNEKAFNMLFVCHKKLLHSICFDRYQKYRWHLHSDDLDEIKSIVYCEFYRRVTKYKIPPEAPFSKYVKLYMKKWTNVYVKLMVKKRDRFVQFNRYENN